MECEKDDSGFYDSCEKIVGLMPASSECDALREMTDVLDFNWIHVSALVTGVCSASMAFSNDRENTYDALRKAWGGMETLGLYISGMILGSENDQIKPAVEKAIAGISNVLPHLTDIGALTVSDFIEDCCTEWTSHMIMMAGVCLVAKSVLPAPSGQELSEALAKRQADKIRELKREVVNKSLGENSRDFRAAEEWSKAMTQRWKSLVGCGMEETAAMEMCLLTLGAPWMVDIVDELDDDD